MAAGLMEFPEQTIVGGNHLPIYKYKCMECEHSVELVQSMKEGEDYQASVTTCEKCNSPEWKRVIGGTAFKLQGYGWYKDGY